jgi:hypothetical protein
MATDAALRGVLRLTKRNACAQPATRHIALFWCCSPANQRPRRSSSPCRSTIGSVPLASPPSRRPWSPDCVAAEHRCLCPSIIDGLGAALNAWPYSEGRRLRAGDACLRCVAAAARVAFCSDAWCVVPHADDSAAGFTVHKFTNKLGRATITKFVDAILAKTSPPKPKKLTAPPQLTLASVKTLPKKGTEDARAHSALPDALGTRIRLHGDLLR